MHTTRGIALSASVHVTLGNIEDDSMSVELWCSVAFDGPCGVMLEGRSHKLARGFRCMDVADPCLRVAFQLTQRHAHAFTVRFSNTIITTHKCSQRN